MSAFEIVGVLLAVVILALVAALLLYLLRRNRTEAAGRSTSAEAGPGAMPVDPSKLDPRLREFLERDPVALHRLKREEDGVYRTELAEIETLRARAFEADEEAANELIADAERRLEALPLPITFGLYFPEDDPRDVIRVTHLKTPFVSATIRSDASLQDLTGLGVHVRNQARNIFTAYVPLDLIERLQRSPAIEYIEVARPWEPDLNNALPQTQIDTLHAAALPVTGNGVIVGVIDSGFDFYHPDFRNNDGAGGDGQGSTRVLFLWVQTLTPQGAEAGPPVAPALPGFNPGGIGTYGVEYSQANINAELNNFQSPPAAGQPPATLAYQIVRSAPGAAAHGTLVASCAAGNGRGSFTGAAPNADIIYVRKGTGNNYVYADSTNVLDGFAYIFARAAQLGQPCVVNLSSSDNLGGHDGSTNGEQFMDNLLLTAGRAITCAAGNTNTQGSHTNGTVVAGGTTNAVLVYNSADFNGDGVIDRPRSNDTIHLWYDGHDRFTTTLTVPTAAPTVIGPVVAGASLAVNLPNGIQVTVNSVLDDPRNNDNLIEIRMTGVSSANPLPPGNWNIALQGTTVINGSFEAWVDRSNRGFRSWQTVVANNGTLAVPASALRPLAVGAHDAAAAPAIAASSGQGPTRDGRIKPEIAAPGIAVNGARSRNMNLANPGALARSSSGTSFAAPIAAGASALLFECRGAGLTWADIKQVFADQAGAPGGGVPSNSFGFGFLQMANACAPPATDVDTWIRDATDDGGGEPYTGDVAWLSPDIVALDAGGNPAANPTYDESNLWNNLIDVTVRNRGTQTARNIEVWLYWADPGTNLPFPSEWKTSGIYTGDPGFVQQANKIVVDQLVAGVDATVRFAWAPPAPGSNIRGDDHFCLLVRIEQQADPSNINAGGWPVIRGSNNIALRNVHVQAAADGDADVATAFFVIGSADIDSLEIFAQDLEGELEFTIPTRALPWRELVLLERLDGPRHPYGVPCVEDPLEDARRVLKRADVERITGGIGAELAYVEGATTRLIAGLGQVSLKLPEVRVSAGARMPVRVRVRGPKLRANTGFVHVAQRSGGKIIGGVSLEIRDSLPVPNRFNVRREGDRAVVEPR